MTTKFANAVKKAQLLERALDRNSYELAMHLREVKRCALFTFDGCKNFKEWANKFLKMGYQNALNLSIAGDTIVKFKFTQKEVAEIGLTKVLVIGPHLNKDNRDDLSVYAKRLSTVELKGTLRTEKKTRLGHTFYLTPSQGGKLVMALDMSGDLQLSGNGRPTVDSKAAALMTIVDAMLRTKKTLKKKKAA